MKIEVTEDHISEGKAGSVYWCPVALAIKEQVKHAQLFGVGVAVIFSNKNAYLEIIWKLPRNVRMFIKRFDEGAKVKPIGFNLPQNAVRQLTAKPKISNQPKT